MEHKIFLEMMKRNYSYWIMDIDLDLFLMAMKQIINNSTDLRSFWWLGWIEWWLGDWLRIFLKQEPIFT